MADTARGGLNYGINVSGNFDSEFQSFISQAKALKKEVRDIRDVFKTTSASAAKASTKAEKDRTKEIEKQSKAIQEQERERAKGAGTTADGINKQRQAINNATKAQRGFQQSVQDTEKSGTRLLFTFRRLVGILAVFTIARQLTTSVVEAVAAMRDLNKETETTVSSVASLIATVGEVRGLNGELLEGIDAYNSALSLSNNLVNQLKIDAAAVGVELEAALTGIRAGLAPGLSAGLGLDEIRTTTLDIVRAARLLEVPASQVAEEVRSILSGTIRLTTTRLAPLFDNEQIRNAREQGNLLEVLQDGLRVFNENAEAVSQTYQGLAGSVNALGKEIIRSGGIEYFNALKEALGDIKGLLADGTGSTVLNPDAVDIVREVADGLRVFVQEVTEVIKSEKAFEAFSTVAEFVGASLETAGRVGSEALDLLLKTADNILPPFTAFLEVVNRIIETLDDAGILGGLTSILAGIIAWRLATSQILLLKQTLLKTMLQTAQVTTQLVAQERSRVSLNAQLGVGARKNNTLLSRTRNIVSDLNLRAVALSAGLSLGIGLLITGITKAASEFGKIVDEAKQAEEILKKSEDIAKGLRSEIGEIPPALDAAVKPTKEIQAGLEKLEESTKNLRANLQISSILADVEGASKKALETLLATTREAEKLNRVNAQRLKQNREQQDTLEQNKVLQDQELRFLAAKRGANKEELALAKAKNQDNIDNQELVSKLESERESITDDIRKRLLDLGDEQIVKEQNLLKAQQRRLKELQDAQSRIGRAAPAPVLAAGLGSFQAQAQAQTRSISGIKESAKLQTQIVQIALDREKTEKSLTAVEETRIAQIQASNALKAEEKQLTDSIADTEKKVTENANLKAQEELVSSKTKERSNKNTIRLLDIEIKELENKQSLAEDTDGELQSQLDILDKQIEREEALLKISDKNNDLALERLSIQMQAQPEGEVRNKLEEEYQALLEEGVIAVLEQEAAIESLTAQREKATQAGTLEAVQTDLTADRRSLQLQTQIADQREQINRTLLETATIRFPGAEREAILAQQSADTQQRKLALTEKTLQAQQEILQAEIRALPAGEERTKKQQELTELQIQSIGLLDLERAKLTQLQAQAQESAFFTSQSFTEGLDRGFQDFLDNTEALAPQIANIISGALVDVSGVVADVFKDAIDPRTNPDIKTAFGEFFLDLAGQLVEAATQQLTKQALVALGVEQGQDASAIATNQNTLALQNLTAALTTQAGKGADAGGAGAGGLGGLFGAQETSTAGDSTAGDAAAAKETGSFLGGLTASNPLFLAIILPLIAGLIGQFFNKGGQVQSFDSGGTVNGNGGASSIPRPSYIPKSDTVPAWLTPGEVVMQNSAVEEFGAGLLLAMNSGRVSPEALLGGAGSAIMASNTAPIRHFAGGGMVGNSSSIRSASRAASQAQQVVLPVLPANNRTMEQLVSGGTNSFRNGVNDTDIVGDPNKSGGW